MKKFFMSVVSLMVLVAMLTVPAAAADITEVSAPECYFGSHAVEIAAPEGYFGSHETVLAPAIMAEDISAIDAMAGAAGYVKNDGTYAKTDGNITIHIIIGEKATTKCWHDTNSTIGGAIVAFPIWMEGGTVMAVSPASMKEMFGEYDVNEFDEMMVEAGFSIQDPIGDMVRYYTKAIDTVVYTMWLNENGMFYTAEDTSFKSNLGPAIAMTNAFIYGDTVFMDTASF